MCTLLRYRQCHSSQLTKKLTLSLSDSWHFVDKFCRHFCHFQGIFLLKLCGHFKKLTLLAELTKLSLLQLLSVDIYSWHFHFLTVDTLLTISVDTLATFRGYFYWNSSQLTFFKSWHFLQSWQICLSLTHFRLPILDYDANPHGTGGRSDFSSHECPHSRMGPWKWKVNHFSNCLRRHFFRHSFVNSNSWPHR